MAPCPFPCALGIAQVGPIDAPVPSQAIAGPFPRPAQARPGERPAARFPMQSPRASGPAARSPGNTAIVKPLSTVAGYSTVNPSACIPATMSARVPGSTFNVAPNHCQPSVWQDSDRSASPCAAGVMRRYPDRHCRNFSIKTSGIGRLLISGSRSPIAGEETGAAQFLAPLFRFPPLRCTPP